MSKRLEITLRQVDAEKNGSNLELKAKDEKTYPIRLTQQSLKLGQEAGITNQSLMASLKKIGTNRFSFKKKKGRNMTVIDRKVDTYTVSPSDRRIPYIVIYLGFIGANPNENIRIEQFLSMFRYSYSDTLNIYADLLGDYIARGGKLF